MKLLGTIIKTHNWGIHMNSNANRIITLFALSIGLAGYTDARPLIEIQKDIGQGLQEAYQHLNVYTEDASCSLTKVGIEEFSLPESEQEDAIYVIFYNSHNAPILFNKLPNTRNYQVIPTDIEYIKEILENAPSLAQTPVEKQFFLSLIQAIDTYVDKNNCLILTIDKGADFINLINSNEFEEYTKVTVGKPLEELMASARCFCDVEQANYTMCMIALLTFLPNYQLTKFIQ